MDVDDAQLQVVDDLFAQFCHHPIFFLLLLQFLQGGLQHIAYLF
jgi:hypothetical protein